jgi:branched-subunit amino acid transport protein
VSAWGSVDGWLAIAGLALGTFLIRYSFIGFLAGRRLSPLAERALQLAVPAIFAALVIPLVVMHNGELNWATRYPHAIGMVAAGAYAWWRGGMLIPIVIGMSVMHGVSALR